MTTTPAPQPPSGAIGVLHIVRQPRPGDPTRAFDFLISFGGHEGQQGAFQLAKVYGLDNLVQMLKRMGISRDQIDAAAHLLTTEDQHEIEDVQIPRDVLRNLGLADVRQLRRRDGTPNVPG